MSQCKEPIFFAPYPELLFSLVGRTIHSPYSLPPPQRNMLLISSRMDSYNLSWKLIHSLHGLTPASKPGDKILDTFEIERQTIAQELIAFDKEFSSMFSGKIGAGDGQECLTHEQFLEVFSTGNGFTSGCGIEYPENLLVEKASSEGVVHGRDYLSGILRPGRRLLNVKVKRHTDGARRDLQDGQLVHSVA